MLLPYENGFSPSEPVTATPPAPARTPMPLEPGPFMQMLDAAIQQHERDQATGALMLISIDNLAMIISGYGRDASEAAVSGLMTLIAKTLSPQDTISRLQRDQLGVVLTRSSPADTEAMAARVSQVIQNYGCEHFATSSLHVIATIGAVHFPEETLNSVDALDKAYVALHSSQESFYRPFSSTHAEVDACRQQMGLASYLYSAFQEKRLRLAWQPIVETKTGKVAHYEALLRLVGLNGKLTSAGALIPVAEKMGLIESIDMLVLDMVAQELKANDEVSLAFNVSNLTTENPVWMERLQALVKDAPEIASRMIVEITETAMHRDLRRAAYFVAAVQAVGAQVALDDFGSGYTSFRQIKTLSVDMVKIDGVFIKDLAQNADNQFFVKTLLDFTKGFGLPTIAEFVETGEVAKILMEMGVDYMQGYYFGKPETARRWLTTGEYSRD